MRKEKRKEVSFGLGFFLLDRILKFLAASYGYAIINQGVSFGLLLPGFFVILLIAALILLLFVSTNHFTQRGLWLVVFGGMSNFLDRFIYGGVVDYLKLPIFLSINLADLMITGGVILLLVDLLKTKTLS